MNVEEVERLLNQADAQTPIGIRDRAMMEVLYSSAMRRGELCNLSHYDIDWERRLLTIRQGKNKKDRIVPIGQRAVDWLFKYLQDVRPELAAGKFAKRTCKRWRRDPTDKLFLSNFGAAMNPVSVSLLMRAYIEAAGIDKRGACHIFRHTAATLMLENGADLRSIQTLLGHENLNTTQIYTHIAIDHLRKVHDATHPAKPDKSPGSVNH
jgi:integrase/recombinase XerD